MAFRVFPFPYASIRHSDELASASCEIVGESDAYDAVFFWIDPSTINEFRLPASLTWLGYFVGSDTPNLWVALPPSAKESGLAKGIEAWKQIEVVYNGDPVDALNTFLRKRFIGLPYAEYLQTPHWQEIREAALKAADYRCQVCYSPERVQVHHRTYDRRGRELPSDVTVLCADCHGRFHDKLPKE